MSSTNYTFSDLLNAIQSGNITQAETILQDLYQNGNISQNEYNYAEALINTIKSLGLEGEPILNIINTLVSTFEQQYQNSIVSGNMSNVSELALSIDAISKFFPQYETMIPPIVRKLSNKITAMFGYKNSNNNASALPPVSLGQTPAQSIRTQAQSIRTQAMSLAPLGQTPAQEIRSNLLIQ